ncbi:hypothetical protein SSX86_010519 [Deinandra increscens subsp. villosa]|uniref:F-box domain-containing protein n=1 Tax=Deinandra increscens subsp. villosa TaxID=3103831 RepID=A0AAP0DFF1_9ASTR
MSNDLCDRLSSITISFSAISNDLCEEIIIEIFSRLPTKSLLRFRTVSKSLYALIGSPRFIRSHALRSPKRYAITHEVRHQEHARSLNMYTIHSESQLSSYAGITPIKYPFGNNRTHIMGSCDGVLCVYDWTMKAFHLWNPSIRRKVTVHELPSSDDDVLAFGFFLDPVTHDYKILKMNEACTTVYAMKTRSWSEIAPPTPPIGAVTSFQCLFDGSLHWAAGRRTDDRDYCYFILRLDLRSAVFSTVELPERCREPRHVTVIKGCLAVICTESYIHGIFDSFVWVKNTKTGADGSWSVAFKVDRRQCWQSAHGDLFFSYYSDGYYSDGILVFNPETKSKVRSKVSNLKGVYFSCILDMCMFTESLGLLDVGRSCDMIRWNKSSKRNKRGRRVGFS